MQPVAADTERSLIIGVLPTSSVHEDSMPVLCWLLLLAERRNAAHDSAAPTAADVAAIPSEVRLGNHASIL